MFGGYIASTKLILNDGSVKRIDQLTIHDKLLAEDGTEINILSGPIEEQVSVINVLPNHGEPFIISSNGSLRLKSRSNKPNFQREKNYSIKISNLSQYDIEKYFKFYKPVMTFKEETLPVHPYLYGFWLGHGQNNLIYPWYSLEQKQKLKEKYQTIFDYMEKNCQVQVKDGNTQYLKGFSVEPNIEIMNIARQKEYKFIPKEYKKSSIEQRRLLLAGFIDSCGHCKDYTFDVSLVNEILLDDICFIANSLGFKCKKIENSKRNKHKKRKLLTNSFRALISGKLEDIPCQLKIHQFTKREHLRDITLYGFHVEYQPEELKQNLIFLKLDKEDVGCFDEHLRILV